MKSFFLFFFLWRIFKCLGEEIRNTTRTRLPILYIYTVGSQSCKWGLPAYIRVSLEQAILSQPDWDVILGSNYAECDIIAKTVDGIDGLIKYDINTIVSNRTKEFAVVAEEIFAGHSGGDLWITSALRFFSMEDFMIEQGYDEVMHVEADNLLYGKFTDLLPVLRAGYKGLAATPLNDKVSFITASVLWIANIKSMIHFNDYLLNLGRNRNKEWKGYLTWLRPYGCCVRNGIDPDEKGKGIKPFAINEMSMLAYYRYLHPDFFLLLPVVPEYPYILNRYISNISSFGPTGSQVGPATGGGIWDPNSWGQFTGGTSIMKGKNKGFSDPSHIAGQAIRTNGCKAEMMCSNITINFPVVKNNDLLPNKTIDSVLVNRIKYENTIVSACYTAPYVRCFNSTWTPLWNLHVHSKHTNDFRSQKCECFT